MRFPEGKSKAVTLSYDGSVHNKQLVDTIKPLLIQVTCGNYGVGIMKKKNCPFAKCKKAIFYVCHRIIGFVL